MISSFSVSKVCPFQQFRLKMSTRLVLIGKMVKFRNEVSGGSQWQSWDLRTKETVQNSSNPDFVTNQKSFDGIFEMERFKMYHRFWFFNWKTWIFETKDIQTFNLWLENDTNSFLSVEYLTETKFKYSSTCESLPMFSIHQNVPCLHYSSSTTSLLHWSTKEPSSSFGPESTHYRTSKTLPRIPEN